MDIDDELTEDTPTAHYLDTVEGEIAFFRALTRARPVGIHRHFHVLTMRNAIRRDTGRLVSVPAIWDKLRRCYDLDILESIEADGYETPAHTGSPPVPVPSPSPSENLSRHPFFRREYALPAEDAYEALVAVRRMRATASLPSSSPAPSPSHHVKIGAVRGGRKGKSKLKHMAGLVGGDSDSSALTQESGDESIAPTPRGSVATGTDAGTEYAEEEEAEGFAQSPGASISSKQIRKTTKPTRRGGSRGRGRLRLVCVVLRRKRNECRDAELKYLHSHSQ
ncbi:hypothetical protein A0H81_08787 [Grifola frondosa]|uniref:Chromatin modification-related protein EAF7 n=1 Tax=Grifola frondosa TaxID=5627 RepID=A0A1C7M9M3_GRIFR|nr:hypothetical protein A0H81_08787 [Grifola frondosa]